MTLAVEVKLLPGEPKPHPDLIRRVGKALYGEHWLGSLANDLGVTPKSLRRWIRGNTQMPRHLGRELMKLVNLRAEDLHFVSADLESYEIMRLDFERKRD